MTAGCVAAVVHCRGSAAAPVTRALCTRRVAHVYVSTGVNLRQGNPIISQAEWDGSTWLVRMQPQSAKSKVKSVTKRIQLESDGRLVRAGGVRGVGTGAMHHRATSIWFGCQCLARREVSSPAVL